MAGPPIKPYSMSEIKSKLLQPALTSHFICEFFPPPGVNNFLGTRGSSGFGAGQYSGAVQELIQISCSEASLPGSSLATNDINNDYTGVTERHAYRRMYDDRADFTFYVDSNYYVIDFFENWISYVVGEDSIKGQQNRYYNYRINFPDEYKTDDLYITKFERHYDKEEKARPLTYKFINAYPISVSSMPVSYDSSQLLKCTVSFNYTRYVISKGSGQFADTTEPGQSTSPNSIAEQIRRSQSLNENRINRPGQAGANLPFAPNVT